MSKSKVDYSVARFVESTKVDEYETTTLKNVLNKDSITTLVNNLNEQRKDVKETIFNRLRNVQTLESNDAIRVRCQMDCLILKELASYRTYRQTTSPLKTKYKSYDELVPFGKVKEQTVFLQATSVEYLNVFLLLLRGKQVSIKYASATDCQKWVKAFQRNVEGKVPSPYTTMLQTVFEPSLLDRSGVNCWLLFQANFFALVGSARQKSKDVTLVYPEIRVDSTPTEYSLLRELFRQLNARSQNENFEPLVSSQIILDAALTISKRE